MTAPLSDGPAKYDFEVYQGDTKRFFVWLTDAYGEPLDLSGHTARLDIYQQAYDNTPALQLDSDGNGLTVPTQTGNWQGEFSSGTSYSEDDVVLYDKIYWIAKQDTSVTPPGQDSPPDANWDYSPLGRVDVEITASQSESLRARVHTYDLQTVSGSTVDTHLHGDVVVTRERTRNG